jgi:hypothetical protein
VDLEALEELLALSLAVALIPVLRPHCLVISSHCNLRRRRCQIRP